MTTYTLNNRLYVKTKNRDYFLYKNNLFFYDCREKRFDEVRRPFQEIFKTYLLALTI